MALSTQDMKRWRDRLEHARRVWTERGYRGTSSQSTMRAINDYRRGEHWRYIDGFSELPDAMKVTINKVFSGANRMMATLGASNPKVQFIPRGPESSQASVRGQELINYDIQELDMQQQFNRALDDHMAAPLGIVRHGFTPEDEYFNDKGRRIHPYRAERPDKPWIRRMPLWDVLMDCTKEGFHADHGIEWVAFRDMLTVEQIRQNPHMTAREGITPNIQVESRIHRSQKLLDDQNEDVLDKVEFYTVYSLNDQTWFQLTLDHLEKPLRDESDWPITWEHLPVDVLGVHQQMDDPFPLALLESSLPIQQELDRAYTIISLVARNTRQHRLYNNTIIDPTEIDKLVESAVVEYFGIKGPPSEAVMELKAGGFPQELLLWIQLLETELREQQGTSQMDRAQRINVESAQEAANVQQGSDILQSRPQRAFEKFITEALRNYIHARRETMLESELVPILGAEGASEAIQFLEVSPSDLQYDYDFRVVAGSTLPDSKDREAQKSLIDLQALANFSDQLNMKFFISRYLEAREIAPAKAFRQGIEAPSDIPPETKGIDPQSIRLAGGAIQ